MYIRTEETVFVELQLSPDDIHKLKDGGRIWKENDGGEKSVVVLLINEDEDNSEEE